MADKLATFHADLPVTALHTNARSVKLPDCLSHQAMAFMQCLARRCTMPCAPHDIQVPVSGSLSGRLTHYMCTICAGVCGQQRSPARRLLGDCCWRRRSFRHLLARLDIGRLLPLVLNGSSAESLHGLVKAAREDPVSLHVRRHGAHIRSWMRLQPVDNLQTH